MLWSSEPRRSMLVAVSKQPVKASDTCGDREREALSVEYLALHLIPPQLNSYQTLFLFFSAFVYCFVFSKFPTKRRKYELSARGQILHSHLLTRSRVTPCQLFSFSFFAWRDKQISAVNGRRFRRYVHDNNSTGFASHMVLIRGPFGSPPSLSLDMAHVSCAELNLMNVSHRERQRRRRSRKHRRCGGAGGRETICAFGHSKHIRVRRTRS